MKKREIKRYAVIGDPILHSKSPDLYNYVFKKQNINSFYSRICSNNCQEAYNLLKFLDLNGANITAPYKKNIYNILLFSDTISKMIGTVNTITNKKGFYEGYNTDYIGIINTLKNNSINITNKNVLIIGYGCTAQTGIFAMKELKANIFITGRNTESVNSLAKDCFCKAVLSNKIKNILPSIDLIFSALPSHSEKFFQEWFDFSKRKKNLVIFDANYNNSYFKQIAIDNSIKFISGIELLYHQAMATLELYTGTVPKYDISEHLEMLNNLADRKDNTIYLIGFMGSGKTTLGKELAESLKYKFIDTDKLIEEKVGQSINAIFEKYGEEYFRNIESMIINKFINKKKYVIACGGGTVLSEPNRAFLKQYGTIVWLYASFSTILQRINFKRPLIDPEKINETKNLFLDREDVYFSCADLIINNNETIKKTCELLKKEITLL